MTRHTRWLMALLAGFCLCSTLHAAPLIEVRDTTLDTSLSAYVDVLEDPDRNLTVEDVSSERHGYRFASAPLTELFFGYTQSAYWIRFVVENQRPTPTPLVLDVMPTDLDYLDAYVINPATHQQVQHYRTGSALPTSSRPYQHPLYLFDLDVPPGETRAVFLRVESDKTINLQLHLSTQHALLTRISKLDRWQGFLLGGLLAMACLYAGLFSVFRHKGFLWCSLFLFSVLMIQIAWNGYLLPFFTPKETLLDHQILTPIYLAILFSALYAQSILQTRQRVFWQHKTLDLFVGICLIGTVMTWFVAPDLTSQGAIIIALLSTVAIFSFTLHANMEGQLLARYFLFARTLTSSIILVAVFNAHGYMPQGAFTAWGVSTAVLCESGIMLVVLCLYCLKEEQQRLKHLPTIATATATRSVINLSEICHELRTPVSGILGMTDLLLEASLTEQQRHQVKTIRKSGQALLDAANRIADLSQIETGNITLSMSPFDLCHMIETAVDSCRSKAESSNLELIYHIDALLPTTVYGDAGKLQQILINMINFTLRHLEKGEVILNVTAGMANEVIFDIRSGNNTLIDRTLSPDKNTLNASDQLNITIAEQYLLLMGSKLTLHTYVGEGVNLSFNVMLEETPVAPTPVAVPSINSSLDGKRMLVVDDNATCCAIIEQQAMQWGMSVTTAYGGKEALAVMRSSATLTEPFDILLTDYEMPGMTGLELVRHLQDDPRIQHENLIVVMLTGLSNTPFSNEANRSLVQMALYKPISGKSLKKALETALIEHLEKQGVG